jgi:hypothetical protein
LGILTDEDAARIAAAETARWDVIQVDEFSYIPPR